MCTYTRQFIKMNSMMSIKWEEITLEGHDVVPVDLIELLLTWCPCDLVCNFKTL